LLQDIEHTKSKTMRDALEILERVAPSDLTVIMSGEPGTGKEWAARLIHRLSPRSNGPFHAIDCSALPEDQVEKEIFGYEAISWDGIDLKRSAFEEAAGGTLFMQDLDSMSDVTQLKIARTIEYLQFRRVGGEQLHEVGARLIVGVQGQFSGSHAKSEHHDAFAQRATAITIEIPPLRKRKSDIPILIRKLMVEMQERYGHHVEAISPEAVALCSAYSWPGNVRQLKNAIEYASVMCRDKVILPEHLPSYVRETNGRNRASGHSE
jgi:DNA-binding NtrC family response regulator